MKKTRSNDLPPNVTLDPAPEQMDSWGWVNGHWANFRLAPPAPWVLTEAIAHSPSRFILGWYATPEAAQADAWDRASAHDARRAVIARQAERTNARIARQRLAQQRREQRRTPAHE